MINVEQIIADYQRHRRALARSESSVQTETGNLQRFFAFLEQERITELTDVDNKVVLRYQIYLSSLLNTHGKLYHTQTQNVHLVSVRNLFKYLRRKGVVFVNPTEGIEWAREPKPLPRDVLSVPDMERLIETPKLRSAMGLRDRALLEMLYSTAVRASEIIKFDMTDINYESKTALIREPKNGRDRVVPVGRLAFHYLKRYIMECRPNYIEKDEQAVFVNVRGERLSRQGLLEIVQQYGEKAKLEKKVCLHGIRHSCATHLADAGCDIRYISQLLGHADLNTTLKYIHLSIRHLREAHAKFHPREIAAQKLAEKTA